MKQPPSHPSKKTTKTRATKSSGKGVPPEANKPTPRAKRPKSDAPVAQQTKGEIPQRPSDGSKAQPSPAARPPLPLIEETFRRHFLNWSIELPAEAVRNRDRGQINRHGWSIWYLFGEDETGEYLDYYSSHRMTEDNHVRLYADGRFMDLDCYLGFRFLSPDPVEDARLEARFVAHQQKVTRILAEKGFLSTGSEPGGVAINRFLIDCATPQASTASAKKRAPKAPSARKSSQRKSPRKS